MQSERQKGQDMSGTQEKEHKSGDAEDPRVRCCHGGTHFFNAILAMISRLIFLLHLTVLLADMLSVEEWKYNIYGMLGLSYVVLVTEALVVLCVRRGNEWKWFSPSILFYVMISCPHVWLMEEARFQGKYVLSQLPNTNITSGVILSELGIPAAFPFTWTWAHSQVLLLAIIVSRWLMPKGDLTRDQLSALLVMYLATASDIVDFFNILEEVGTFNTPADFHILLAVWAWSMLQFPFVRTATRSDDTDELEDNDLSNTGNRKLPWYQKVRLAILSWLENESWSLMISIIFQDGPYLMARIYLASNYEGFNRTTLFFISKNILVLVLQMYRLIALHIDRRHVNEQRTRERMKNTLSMLTRTSFMKNMGGIKDRRQRKLKGSTSVKPLDT